MLEARRPTFLIRNSLINGHIIDNSKRVILRFREYEYGFGRRNSLLEEEVNKLNCIISEEGWRWVFHVKYSDEVKKIDEIFNSEYVNVELVIKKTPNLRENAVVFCGYTIVKKHPSSDCEYWGAELGEKVKFKNSSDSHNITIDRIPLIFQIQKGILKEYFHEHEDFDVKILD